MAATKAISSELISIAIQHALSTGDEMSDGDLRVLHTSALLRAAVASLITSLCCRDHAIFNAAAFTESITEMFLRLQPVGMTEQEIREALIAGIDKAKVSA